MATIRSQNRCSLSIFILNIVILIELCRTAPTLTSTNLTDTSKILFSENITKESYVTSSSIIGKFKINLGTTDFPHFIRNTTKPIEKSKKITKNINIKKVKEKKFNNPVKLQDINNLVNKTPEIDLFTVSTPLVTTQDILTEAGIKVLAEKNNHRYSENMKAIKDTEISKIQNASTLPLITISPLTTTITNHSNTTKHMQITSTTGEQHEVKNFTTSPTISELTMSTQNVTVNDKRKLLLTDEIESSVPSTMNISRLQGQNKTKVILLNNSISSESSENNYIVTPVVTDLNIVKIEKISNLNIANSTPEPTLLPETFSQNSLNSSSDLINYASQISLSEDTLLKLTTESHIDNTAYTTNAPLLEKGLKINNNIMFADTLKLKNIDKIFDVDLFTNKNSKIKNESSTLSNFKDNPQNIIENAAVMYTKTRFNNSSGTLMGHDGFKITKKKQLTENNFKNDKPFVQMNNASDSTYSKESINDKEIEKYNKLSTKETTLNSLIINEETLIDITTEQNDFKSNNLATATNSSTEENIKKITTNALAETGTLTLDVDLMAKNLQLDSITEIPILTTTENEFSKHKNFEKSLITKMEWIPIENADHTETKLIDLKQASNRFNTVEQTTIFPFQLTSEINEYQTTHEVLPNTEFYLTTKQRSETEQKSLEIELIDSPTLSDKNVKSVPEFFEIATSKQHQNNNEKESDSLPIEIQINVSEGFGNETENLEFSFRQQPQNTKQKHTAHHVPPGFQEIGEITIERKTDLNTIQAIPLLDDKNKNLKLKENDEILQVEITATDNTTKADERQSEIFNDTPKFTVHNEQNLEIRENDDFFVPDLTMDTVEDTVVSKNLVNSERESVDQDADTIFYISNTEVKVAESLPSSNSSNHELIQSGKNLSLNSNRSKLESQFFPTIFDEDVVIETPVEQQNQLKITDTSSKKNKHAQKNIILSSKRKNFESQKIIKNPVHGEIILNSAEKSYKSPAAVAAAAAPDVSYVGETFIEIEESTSIPTAKDNRKFTESHTIKTTTSINKDTDFPVIIMDADMKTGDALLSDVIVQPAIVPEMSIGVPVIGELPPQIELKEIDFLPVNDDKENYDKLIDGGSIQYGADVIADEAEINDNPNRYIFESGYPFTNEKISRVGRVRNNDESDMLEKDENDADEMTNSQQIIMHAVNNLQRDQLIAEVPSDRWEGYKENPIKRNNDKSYNIVSENSSSYMNNSTNLLNSTGANSTELLGNATAFSVLEENEGSDFNLADIQTLIIACFATLIPLILSLLTAFGVRYLWIKYRRDQDEGSGLVGDSSTDPLAPKSAVNSRDELQSTESGYTLNRSNNTLESNINITSRNSGTIIDGVLNGVGGNDEISHCTNGSGNIKIASSTNQPNGNTAINISLSNHSGANGSVTTMTLKNNHLIVETEERNDISRDARETKMHYTSSEKDGVFVVEVARGADSTGAPGSPNNNMINHQKSYNIDMEIVEETKTKKTGPDDCKHEEVQIHQPPADSDTLIEIDNHIDSPSNTQKYKKCQNLENSNTGLSQSDLSSSSDDSNKAYSYGKQELYTIPINRYSPLSVQPKIPSPQSLKCFVTGISSDKISEIEGNENNFIYNRDNSETKPIITAALLKQDTINELNSVANTKLNLSNSEDIYNGNNKTMELNQHEIDLHDIKIPVSNVSFDIDENNKNNQIEGQDSTKYKNGVNSDEKISGLEQKNIQRAQLDIYENANTNGTKKNCAKETENQIGKGNCIDIENEFDSIISLPEPPSTEEIKQMNEIILIENSQLDSLPPPSPPLTETATNGNTNSFNNISPIPESIIVEDKLLDTDDCVDQKILTLSTSKEEHLLNELQNGIGAGGTVVSTPLTVFGSS